MYKPDYQNILPTMFICGDHEASKKTVTGILTDFGWETEEMGRAEAARAIEPLCMLWCTLVFYITGGHTHSSF